MEPSRILELLKIRLNERKFYNDQLILNSEGLKHLEDIKLANSLINLEINDTLLFIEKLEEK